MKFALIIPTRGDRPEFIEQCKHLIKNQTLQPDEVIWMDYPPESAGKDITQRYRRGVEQATKNGHKFVVFWEDDDWYHPQYLEWLVGEWKKKRMPNFFGVGETYYYHLALGKRHHMSHPNRTSAFSTLVKLPFACTWPSDNYAFLDLYLHKHSNVITVSFPKNKVYAVGVKHGIGLSGGSGHNTNFRFYEKDSKNWFFSVVENDSAFYKEMEFKVSKLDVNKQKPNNGNIKVQKRKITVNNTNPQLHRRGTKIRRIRKK